MVQNRQEEKLLITQLVEAKQMEIVEKDYQTYFVVKKTADDFVGTGEKVLNFVGSFGNKRFIQEFLAVIKGKLLKGVFKDEQVMGEVRNQGFDSYKTIVFYILVFNLLRMNYDQILKNGLQRVNIMQMLENLPIKTQKNEVFLEKKEEIIQILSESQDQLTQFMKQKQVNIENHNNNRQQIGIDVSGQIAARSTVAVVQGSIPLIINQVTSQTFRVINGGLAKEGIKGLMSIGGRAMIREGASVVVTQGGKKITKGMVTQASKTAVTVASKSTGGAILSGAATLGIGLLIQGAIGALKAEVNSEDIDSISCKELFDVHPEFSLSILTDQKKMQNFLITEQKIKEAILNKKMRVFKNINRFKIPIKFSQSIDINNKLQVMVLGTVGSGKSTLNNYIMYEYLQKRQIKYNKDKLLFKSSTSHNSVTKNVELKQEKNIISLIDTPGTNDSDPSMSNFCIEEQYISFLKKNDILSSKLDGLSGFVQCIMMNKSGRMDSSSIRAMTRFLLSFTYLYPEFQVFQAPRINVFLTDFSIFGNGDPSQCDNPWEEEEKVDAKQYEKNFDNLKKIYREKLVQQIRQDYGVQNDGFLERRISLIFRDDCFYAYRIGQFSKIQKEQENSEIHRFIQDNLDNKKYFIEGEEAQLEPVYREKDVNDEIVSKIKDKLQIQKQEIKKTGYKNCIQKMDKIEADFNQMAKYSPHIMMKLPPQIIDKIHTLEN